MSVVAFTADELRDATRLASEIGAAIRRARRARGESAETAAHLAGWQYTTLVGVERGRPNVKLGTLTRIMARYGLTLRVTTRCAATELYRAEKARRTDREARE